LLLSGQFGLKRNAESNPEDTDGAMLLTVKGCVHALRKRKQNSILNNFSDFFLTVVSSPRFYLRVLQRKRRHLSFSGGHMSAMSR